MLIAAHPGRRRPCTTGSKSSQHNTLQGLHACASRNNSINNPQQQQQQQQASAGVTFLSNAGASQLYMEEEDERTSTGRKTVFPAEAMAGQDASLPCSGSGSQRSADDSSGKRRRTMLHLMSMRRRVTAARTRLFSFTAMILVLAMASLCILQPVSALGEYRGPLPKIPPSPFRSRRGSVPSPRQQDSIMLQHLSSNQHPRWNRECLMQQEKSQAGAAVFGTEGRSSSKEGGLHKRGTHNAGSDKDTTQRWNAPRAVANDVALPVSSFQTLVATNSTNMTCNGRADLCDLRYDQVTYPGTHNSAAYDLQYDCGLATQTCLESSTVCTAQAQNCTMGWETRCTTMSNTCLNRLPNWLHWLCGAFTSACEATEQFCLGWEQICTSSLEVCTLWGSACLEVIPDWALTCLWENQPNHTVSQQLSDGIRFLDLGTCLTNNNTEIVMCHGNGVTRAIGIPLDTVLSEIQQFMLANPYEVLTIEFNEYDGNVNILAQMIVAKVLQYFTLPTGQLMLLPRTSLAQTWPTLRNMILANQRINLFMGDTYWAIPDPKPDWANQKDTWKLDGFTYSSTDTQPAQLNQSYFDWCAQGPPTDGSYILWQQMDLNLAILEPDIVASLKQGKVPELCIEPLAIETNSAMLDGMANYCYTRWPYWFRVRVNDYWEGNLFKVVNQFNDQNVARVKAGQSITPY